MNVISKEFDELAPAYESNRLSSWYQAHAEEILQHCLQIDQGDILDIGCGTGHFLREYLKHKPGVRAVGIDVSAGMIDEAAARAREAGIDNIEFIHADWESFDLEKLSAYNFRIIFCANAFHYFSEPQKATDKFFRALANNGKLYVLERNKSRSLLTIIWGILHATIIRDQVVFYRNSELLAFFEKAGFADVRILRSIKRYFWKNKTFTSISLIEGSKSAGNPV